MAESTPDPQTERRAETVQFRGKPVEVRELSFRGRKELRRVQARLTAPGAGEDEAIDATMELASVLSGILVEELLDASPSELLPILEAGRKVNDLADLKKKLAQGPTTPTP